MGMIFELLSTPPAYLKKALVRSENAGRSREPVRIPFGDHRLQHCVLWEPDVVTHETPVMYFHGGGYLVGTPESMIDAANVYNSMGYRFCSVGFRLMPKNPFPAQVEDAFDGVSAALAWLKGQGLPAERFFVGGSSCGGHLAMLVGYGTELQREHGLDPHAVAGVISVAGITHVDDMLLRPFSGKTWNHFVNLPAERGASRGHLKDGMYLEGEERPEINRASLASPAMRADRHRALLPYSPVELIGRIPSGQWVPPFFAIHGAADKMSPYAHEAAFVEKLQRLYGADAGRLFTVDSWGWQHMWTTVTLHKDRVQESAPLKELFAWLKSVEERA